MNHSLFSIISLLPKIINMKIYIYKNSHTVKGNIEANAAVDQCCRFGGFAARLTNSSGRLRGNPLEIR